MSTIFSKIISGDIPCHKIAEDGDYLAFLDINPLKEGHTLVIPKKGIDYIFDMDDESLSGLIMFSKKVAKAIKKAIPCKKVGVSVVGLEVPHAHIHLIPIDSVAEMNFSAPKLSLSTDKLAEIANQIRKNLS
jgi:histidine triad (HIT) family protein